jgi:hypothetical protein
MEEGIQPDEMDDFNCDLIRIIHKKYHPHLQLFIGLLCIMF